MPCDNLYTTINDLADSLTVARTWAQRDTRACAARLPLVHPDDTGKIAAAAADYLSLAGAARSAYINEFCDAVRRIGRDND
jgi:hypothetical protein